MNASESIRSGDLFGVMHIHIFGTYKGFVNKGSGKKLNPIMRQRRMTNLNSRCSLACGRRISRNLAYIIRGQRRWAVPGLLWELSDMGQASLSYFSWHSFCHPARVLHWSLPWFIACSFRNGVFAALGDVPALCS